MPKPKRKPKEPVTMLEVVVIGSCLLMWAYLLWWAGAFPYGYCQ